MLGCSIRPTIHDPQPIVVSTKGEFLYPEPDDTFQTLNLNVGDTVLISCTGRSLTSGSTSLGATITAKCSSGTKFTVGSTTIDFNQLTCSGNPYHTARYTGNSCELGGKEIEIGFLINTTIFAQEMTICFDQINLAPYYALYDLTRSIGHYQSGVPRPTFIEDSFYNLGNSVNNMYVRTGQKTTINGLLGLDAASTKYISDTTDYYLARGHLTAKADYVYGPQQTATFHYCNVAPQWQTFNGGNWNTLEANVRKFAETNRLDLKVYTGTYGVTTLPHAQTGKDVPLYLFSSSSKKAIPVPELYWKVLYDPKTQLGVAFLGINNPYQENTSKSVICTDISSQITWLTWKKTDLKQGYSYACAVDDLRKKVAYLPSFTVKGILK